jgi:MFS family permease
MSAPPGERVGFLDVLRVPEIRAVVLVTFVIMLGFGILSPALPLYAQSFGVSRGAVGLLISAFAIMRLVFDLVAGGLVDRYGERSMATLGAAIVGVSSALAAMAPTFPLLVVFRGAGGAGSSIFFASLMAYLLRTAPRDRVGRVMGVFYGAFNLGIIAGQPVGGLAARYLGLASPLWIYAGACLLSAVLYLRAIHPQGDRPARDASVPRGLRSLPRTRPFATVLVVGLAYAWMIGAVFSTLIPLFGRERVGLSEVGVGLSLAVVSASEFGVLFHAGSLADRLGRRAVMLPAFGLLCATVAVIGLATPLPWFLALMVMLGVAAGYAGVPPTAMLADVAPPRSSGTAIGAFRFMTDVGFVMGPLVAGVTADLAGFGAAFAVSAAPSLVAVLMLLSIPETMRRASSAGSS